MDCNEIGTADGKLPRLLVESRPRFLGDDRLVRGNGPLEWLREDDPRRPRRDRGEQSGVADEEPPEVVGPRHRRKVEEHDATGGIKADRERAGEGISTAGN